jgi:hypothetical protein
MKQTGKINEQLMIGWLGRFLEIARVVAPLLQGIGDVWFIKPSRSQHQNCGRAPPAQFLYQNTKQDVDQLGQILNPDGQPKKSRETAYYITKMLLRHIGLSPSSPAPMPVAQSEAASAPSDAFAVRSAD